VSGVSATIYGGAGGNGSGNGGGAAALSVVQRRRTRKSVGRNFENLLESLSSGIMRGNRFGFRFVLLVLRAHIHIYIYSPI